LYLSVKKSFKRILLKHDGVPLISQEEKKLSSKLFEKYPLYFFLFLSFLFFFLRLCEYPSKKGGEGGEDFLKANKNYNSLPC